MERYDAEKAAEKLMGCGAHEGSCDLVGPVAAALTAAHEAGAKQMQERAAETCEGFARETPGMDRHWDEVQEIVAEICAEYIRDLPLLEPGQGNKP